MGVFPSDHFIGDIPGFIDCLDLAETVAEQGSIVTLGITPTRPETGFGYIRLARGASLGQTQGREAFRVDTFVEKPDRVTAETYLASNDYVWNSGMFIFKPSVLLAEIARQLPAMHEGLLAIADAIGTDTEQEVLDAIFPTLEKVSIDYGIMEQAADIAVIPASIAWSDVGHWAAVDEVRPTDTDGNVVDANALLHEVERSVIYSENPERLIAIAGVKDLVVVDTADALLIIPRDRAQDVRILVDMLRARGKTALQ
jgi:mannose-1-phosphate guanylyltransferase